MALNYCFFPITPSFSKPWALISPFISFQYKLHLCTHTDEQAHTHTHTHSHAHVRTNVPFLLPTVLNLSRRQSFYLRFFHLFLSSCAAPLLSQLSWHLLFSTFSFLLVIFSAVTASCWQWSRTSVWKLGNYWTRPSPSDALCLCVQVIESLLINRVIYHISIERRAAASACLHEKYIYFLWAPLQLLWVFFFFTTHHGRFRGASTEANGLITGVTLGSVF